MLAMHSLVLALSLVGQMGSGVYDGSYDVPSTLYLSNGFTGSNGVTMTFVPTPNPKPGTPPSGVWTGSDAKSKYTLMRALVIDKTTGRWCWLVAITSVAPNGGSGAVGVYPSPAASWGLQGNGFTVTP